MGSARFLVRICTAVSGMQWSIQSSPLRSATSPDLSLQLDMNSRPYESGPAYTEGDLSFLFQSVTIIATPAAIDTQFSSTGIFLQSETKLLLENNTWMALESLSLRRFGMSPATFSAFIQNHTGTLTEVFLAEFGLPSGCQDAWKGLIPRNIPFLNLKAAKIQGLRNHND